MLPTLNRSVHRTVTSDTTCQAVVLLQRMGGVMSAAEFSKKMKESLDVDCSILQTSELIAIILDYLTTSSALALRVASKSMLEQIRCHWRKPFIAISPRGCTEVSLQFFASWEGALTVSNKHEKVDDGWLSTLMHARTKRSNLVRLILRCPDLRTLQYLEKELRDKKLASLHVGLNCDLKSHINILDALRKHVGFLELDIVGESQPCSILPSVRHLVGLANIKVLAIR